MTAEFGRKSPPNGREQFHIQYCLIFLGLSITIKFSLYVHKKICIPLNEHYGLDFH